MHKPCGFLLVDLSSCVINRSKITDNKWRDKKTESIKLVHYNSFSATLAIHQILRNHRNENNTTNLHVWPSRWFSRTTSSVKEHELTDRVKPLLNWLQRPRNLVFYFNMTRTHTYTNTPAQCQNIRNRAFSRKMSSAHMKWNLIIAKKFQRNLILVCQFEWLKIKWIQFYLYTLG